MKMVKTLIEIAALPPKERAAYYREFAREVETWAREARSPEMQEGYRQVAEHWRELAEAIEPHGGELPTTRNRRSPSATRQRRTHSRPGR
jgi:hypothetical protein